MRISNKLHSLIPMSEIEQTAQKQIYDVLSLDCLKRLVIMPDVHAGYDLVIGGVALLDGFISPSFVGYDIGCGMIHVSTGVKTSEMLPDERSRIGLFDQILKTIPTGFASHKTRKRNFPVFESPLDDKRMVVQVREKVEIQCQSLGGGNHFAEVGENRAGEVCITIHSGSRNVGHTIGGTYMRKGRMFPLDSELGQAYRQDMDYALRFALYNRESMLRAILGLMGFNSKEMDRIAGRMINENHNHAIVTQEGVLHRKGATPADLDQLGIIPANMRDGVYITRGLGNQEYLSSASHGCGRRMGRNEAKRVLDVQEFRGQMKGVVSSANRSTLDEAPGAYKDINTVIGYQEGVVIEVVDYVKPLINVKAHGNE